jgi:hypothetical protein
MDATKKRVTIVTQSMFFILIIAGILLFSQISNAANNNGPNNKNVTVRTNVNITNSKPEILAITVFPETNSSGNNITLNAGSMRNVTCNATLRDWNGYNDIVMVNATLWDMLSSTVNGVDNNNSHYTNVNCTNGGNGINYTVNYICVFPVYYYANNGTWSCNITVMDNSSTFSTRGNTTVIYPIYAVNITDGINYGNAAVEDFTVNTTANVTNFGNMAINITVEGYGAKSNDGLAMNCSLGGNITISNERYSLYDIDWTSKNVLTSSPVLLDGLTVSKQTLSDTLMTNATYWQLYVNSSNNPGGNCSGYVIFTATTP